MNSIAILDLGSARLKLLLAVKDEQDAISFQRFKQETGSAGKLTDEGYLDEETETQLVQALGELLQNLPQTPRPTIIATASEIFRKAKNGAAILKHLEEEYLLPTIQLLTPYQEGRLFYDAVALAHDLPAGYGVMDIGGGSVQIAIGTDEASIMSFPIGTYRLEQQHQASKEQTTAEEYNAMRQTIRTALTVLTEPHSISTFVIGSTCMEDFFRAALHRPDETPLTISLADVDALFQEVATKPYKDLASYYPGNPFFMYGADKVGLLIALVMGEAFKTQQIIPTNESLSTGIARLALEEPGELDWIFPGMK